MLAKLIALATLLSNSYGAVSIRSDAKPQFTISTEDSFQMAAESLFDLTSADGQITLSAESEDTAPLVYDAYSFARSLVINSPISAKIDRLVAVGNGIVLGFHDKNQMHVLTVPHSGASPVAVQNIRLTEQYKEMPTSAKCYDSVIQPAMGRMYVACYDLASTTGFVLAVALDSYKVLKGLSIKSERNFPVTLGLKLKLAKTISNSSSTGYLVMYTQGYKLAGQNPVGANWFTYCTGIDQVDVDKIACRNDLEIINGTIQDVMPHQGQLLISASTKDTYVLYTYSIGLKDASLKKLDDLKLNYQVDRIQVISDSQLIAIQTKDGISSGRFCKIDFNITCYSNELKIADISQRIVTGISYTDGIALLQLSDTKTFSETSYAASFRNDIYPSKLVEYQVAQAYPGIIVSVSKDNSSILLQGQVSLPYFFFEKPTGILTVFNAKISDKSSSASLEVTPTFQKPGNQKPRISPLIGERVIAAQFNSSQSLPLQKSDFRGNSLQIDFTTTSITEGKMTAKATYSDDIQIRFTYGSGHESQILKDIQFLNGFAAALGTDGSTLYWFKCSYTDPKNQECVMVGSVKTKMVTPTIKSSYMARQGFNIVWIESSDISKVFVLHQNQSSNFRFNTILPVDIEVIADPKSFTFAIVAAFNKQRKAVDIYLVDPEKELELSFHNTISKSQTKTGNLCPFALSSDLGSLVISSNCPSENKVVVMKEFDFENIKLERMIPSEYQVISSCSLSSNSRMAIFYKQNTKFSALIISLTPSELLYSQVFDLDTLKLGSNVNVLCSSGSDLFSVTSSEGADNHTLAVFSSSNIEDIDNRLLELVYPLTSPVIQSFMVSDMLIHIRYTKDGSPIFRATYANPKFVASIVSNSDWPTTANDVITEGMCTISVNTISHSSISQDMKVRLLNQGIEVKITAINQLDRNKGSYDIDSVLNITGPISGFKQGGGGAVRATNLKDRITYYNTIQLTDNYPINDIFSERSQTYLVASNKLFIQVSTNIQSLIPMFISVFKTVLGGSLTSSFASNIDSCHVIAFTTQNSMKNPKTNLTLAKICNDLVTTSSMELPKSEKITSIESVEDGRYFAIIMSSRIIKADTDSLLNSTQTLFLSSLPRDTTQCRTTFTDQRDVVKLVCYMAKSVRLHVATVDLGYMNVLEQTDVNINNDLAIRSLDCKRQQDTVCVADTDSNYFLELRLIDGQADPVVRTFHKIPQYTVQKLTIGKDFIVAYMVPDALSAESQQAIGIWRSSVNNSNSYKIAGLYNFANTPNSDESTSPLGISEAIDGTDMVLYPQSGERTTIIACRVANLSLTGGTGSNDIKGVFIQAISALGSSTSKIMMDEFFNTEQQPDPPGPKKTSLLWLWVTLIIVCITAIIGGIYYWFTQRKSVDMYSVEDDEVKGSISEALYRADSGKEDLMTV